MIKLKKGQTLIDVDGNEYLTEANDCLHEQRLNSVDHLTDVGLVDKIVQFIRLHPFPLDEEYHTFAEENGYDPDVVESYAYAMLSVILCGGKSKGYEMVVQDNLDDFDIGLAIEREHVMFDDEIDSDAVIKRMQEIYEIKIRNDHLSEDPHYYENDIFIKELEKESKQ